MAKRRLQDDKSAPIRGKPVYESQGERIGQVEVVYSDDATGVAEWAGVASGGAAKGRLLVPLAAAQIGDEGVRIPYSKQQVASAPTVGEADHIPEEIERRIYAHYGIQASERRSDTVLAEPQRGQGQAASRTRQASPEPTLTDELRRGQQEARDIGREVADITKDLGALVQQELQLAKTELGQQLSLSARVAAWGAVAGVFGFLTLTFLSLAGMFALALVFPLWVSALITTAVLGFIAAVAGGVAYRRLRQVSLTPQRTMESVKEDVEWARSQAKSSKK